MPKVENPILLDIPDHFETERLHLRISRAGDGATVHEAIRESHSELKPWLQWAHTLPDLDTIEARERKSLARFILREMFVMLALRKSDGYFVGQMGLYRLDWSVPMFEMGYWVRTSLAGQGYVTEAVNGFTDYSFTHLHAERMEIRCDDRNERSAAVARRAGYTLEGIMRNDMREPDDSLSSGMVFSLLRPEWAKKQA